MITTHVEGLSNSAVIGNVFALGVGSVELDPYLADLVVAVLVNHALPSLLEALRGLVVPPLLDVPTLVELTSLVVETVGDFVADHDADSAKVESLGKVLVVERWLEDARRKHYRKAWS